MCVRSIFPNLIGITLAGLLLLLPAELSAGGSSSRVGMPQFELLSPPFHGGSFKSQDLAIRADGLVAAATDHGVLLFDGEYWSLISHPQRKPAWYVTTAHDGRVFAGFGDDFGFVIPEEEHAEFHSCRKLLNQTPDDIGRCRGAVTTDDAVWLAFEKGLVKIVSQGQVEDVSWFSAGTEQLMSLSLVRDRPVVALSRSGFARLIDGQFVPLLSLKASSSSEAFDSYPVGCCSFGKGKDAILIATYQGGVFVVESGEMRPLNTDLNRLIGAAAAKGVSRLSDNQYVVACEGGVFLFDSQGVLIDQLGFQRGNPPAVCIGDAVVDSTGTIWVPTAVGGTIMRFRPDDGIRFVVESPNQVRWTQRLGNHLLCGGIRELYSFSLMSNAGENGSQAEIPEGVVSGEQGVNPLSENVLPAVENASAPANGNDWNVLRSNVAPTQSAIVVGNQLLVSTLKGVFVVENGNVVDTLLPEFFCFSSVFVPEENVLLVATFRDGVRMLRRQADEDGTRWVSTGTTSEPEGTFTKMRYDSEQRTIWLSELLQEGFSRLATITLPPELSGDSQTLTVDPVSAVAPTVGLDFEIWRGQLIYSHPDGVFQLRGDRGMDLKQIESQPLRTDVWDASFASGWRENGQLDDVQETSRRPLVVDGGDNLWVASGRG
ncbi:MAG: hypothetical protein KDA85_11325, partial [Planctomycetaceae bacterium]|nr:hypothetical protein [Planctomycetaceae bacterium]